MATSKTVSKKAPIKAAPKAKASVKKPTKKK